VAEQFWGRAAVKASLTGRKSGALSLLPGFVQDHVVRLLMSALARTSHESFSPAEVAACSCSIFERLAHGDQS
jgi:hypothetical protein